MMMKLGKRKEDQKCLESFELWCWRRLEKTSWTNCVKNEEVLHRAKEGRNILHTIKTKKANWIGHILRRNCLLKHVTAGRIKVTGIRGRRRQQLLGTVTEKRKH
jgi:hypothetical protein